MARLRALLPFLLVIASTGAAPAHVGSPDEGTLYVGEGIEAPGTACRAGAELVGSRSRWHVAAGYGSALSPEAIEERLRRERMLVLETACDVVLVGSWNLPSGMLEIRSSGTIRAKGASLTAPGLALTLSASSVRLLDGTELVASDSRGAAGSVIVQATGNGTDAPAGSLEIDATSRIDVSALGGSGGWIRLEGRRVAAHGTLLALGRGRIEILASEVLELTAAPDTGGGLLRLDPRNMIVDSFGADSNVATTSVAGVERRSPAADPGGQLDNSMLAGLLGMNNVLVHTVVDGMAAGLESALTGDMDAGDIQVLAPVEWDSDHFLWLAAHDDVIVRANVQNAGSGSVVGIAGWDGSTFDGLDAADLNETVYGNGTGDAFLVGGSANMAPPVAFGSRLGTSVLRARNVSVLGGLTIGIGSNSSFAMLGYGTSDPMVGADGPILVEARGDVSVHGGGGAGSLRFAQIGHGGGVGGTGTGSSDLGGAITVQAGGTVSIVGGSTVANSGNELYAQIGHGGAIFTNAVRGNLAGDILVTASTILLEDGPRSSSYAQIGHGGVSAGQGGSVSTGNVTGDIVVDAAGDLALVSPPAHGRTYAMIGHGGFLNTTGAFDATLGDLAGDITVEVGGRLDLAGGFGTGRAQIGHGGLLNNIGTMGTATGAIEVTVMGDALFDAGPGNNGSACYVQVGHGGPTIAQTTGREATRGTPSGTIALSVDGDLELSGGEAPTSAGNFAYVQVGHGGPVASFRAGATATVTFAGSNVSVDVGGALRALGGGTSLNYVQLGHGGPLAAIGTARELGSLAGTILVSTGQELELRAGPDGDDASAYAQIGHGGLLLDLGVGGILEQADASGEIEVQVGTEISLVDDPTGSEWWLGHRTTGAIVPTSPVLLDIATLDFLTGTGATGATIDDPQFWSRFAVNNLPGGEVTLRVRGLAGNDGALVVEQPLVAPPGTAFPLVLLSSDDVTLAANVDNDGASFVDVVADDANAVPPALSPTALLTIAGGAVVDGNVRFFAVAPAQLSPGTYAPPDQRFAIWYEALGSPVVGANFKVGADLVITKTDAPDPVVPGSQLAYTIAVTNNGPTAAEMVTVSDTLPAGTTYVSLFAPGWSCDTPPVGSGGTVICTVATLPVGTANLTLTVQVDVGATPGSSIENSATVASASTVETTPGDETAAASTLVGEPAAVLVATKTVAGSLVPGGEIVYSITLTNAGSVDQADNAGAELTDMLPSELVLVDALADSGMVVPDSNTNTVTWNGSLAAQASVVITVEATIDAVLAPGTVVTNQAELRYDPDGDLTNEATALSDDPDLPGAQDATSFVVLAPASEIPTLGVLSLAVLAALLGGVAAFVLRRA